MCEIGNYGTLPLPLITICLAPALPSKASTPFFRATMGKIDRYDILSMYNLVSRMASLLLGSYIARLFAGVFGLVNSQLGHTRVQLSVPREIIVAYGMASLLSLFALIILLWYCASYCTSHPSK